MNRARLTDDEILAYQRAKHGNPYMPLSKAKTMQREEYKVAAPDGGMEAADARRALPSPSRAATATASA